MKRLGTHRKQILLALVVLVLAGILVASFLSVGTDSWLGRTTETVIQWVQKPFSAAGNAVRGALSRISRAKELEAENAELKDRVAALEEELRSVKLSRVKLLELEALENALNVNGLEEADIVTTRVTALDRSNWYSAVTIGAGTNDGVAKDDIVVAADGLVGRVVSAGPGWAKVLCAIHDSQNVSFRVFRNLGLIGIVSGAGDGTLSGYLFDTDAAIETGDTLITSGMGIYPENIPIGRVTSFRSDEDSRLVYFTAEPFVDFAKLDVVTVIKAGGSAAQ
jgi:rod shape-determining protein MreC